MNEAITTTQYLLSLDFVQVTLVASALLGILSGVMAPLIVLRQMSFSVHATSELALMGASAALLFGLNVGVGAIAGAIVAALTLAVLGFRGQQDSAVGVASAQSVQIVGALLVMSLMITPGAAAAQITANPVHAVVWSVIFAELAAVGGMIISLAPGIPVSVFVAFISFGIYLVCRVIGRVQRARDFKGRGSSPASNPR